MKASKLDGVNVLLWDIETLPHIGAHWGMWQQNIAGSSIVQQSEMLCISYKWLGEDTIYDISPGNQPDFHSDPYAWSGWLCERIVPIMEQSDFAVAHNGDKFDYKKVKAYTVMNNLDPFRVRTVDTLKMAKSIGIFPKGNKLDNLAEVLGVEQKYKTNMGMWIDIAMNRKNAQEQMDRMVKYCNQDVHVLEQVFLKLWPHCEVAVPNIAALNGMPRTTVACDKCGSVHVYRHGRYIKNVLTYQRYKCQNCGTTFIGRQALKPQEVFDGRD